MATYLHPPRIVHCRSIAHDDRESLCYECASNIRMSSGERSLLCFYASCSNGFRPAVQRIVDKTGLNRSQVFRCRQRLEEHGVIKIDDDTVHIDWQRIRTFASLDPSKTSRHAKIAPVFIESHSESIQPDGDFFQFAPLEDVCSWFAQQTESDFSKWKRDIYRSRQKASKAS